MGRYRCPLPLKKTALAGALGFFLVIIISVPVSILVSCGEFDSVLPVNQTYQVSATAGNYSLDEYSGIRLGDEIQPFFVHSISGDQDITGLTVFLQTPEGKPAGKKIRYSIGEPGEEEDGTILIPAAGTDRKLPRFRLNEELEIGSYRMVFQVLGEKGKVFSETEKAVFYLAGADYGISEISAYLPGDSRDSYLIAPGTLMMLEAKVTADESLDPSVIWYDGKKRIGGGKISAGVNKFFFRIPDESGFRLLRLEAFPFPPDGKSGAGDSTPEAAARGKIRELSLPVSAKGRGPEYFLPAPEERKDFAGHYLFAGDLRDSLDPSPGRLLVKESGGADGGSIWLGYGGIYGLAVGSGDCYLLPRETVGPLDQGSRIFGFRCKMLGDGTVFSVSSADGSVNLDLSREKETLVLALKVDGMSRKVETALPPGEDFISFAVSLDFGENARAAILPPAGTPETVLSLAGFFAGQAICRLGAPAPEKPGADEEAPGEEEKEPPGVPVMILDELSVTVRREE
jgi:hypothetical protein